MLYSDEAVCTVYVSTICTRGCTCVCVPVDGAKVPPDEALMENNGAVKWAFMSLSSYLSTLKQMEESLYCMLHQAHCNSIVQWEGYMFLYVNTFSVYWAFL